MDEEDGYIRVTHDDDDAVCDAVLEMPATTGQAPPLPQADAGVIKEPTTTVEPPPLPQADAGVIKESTTIVEPPRRAGSRQPAHDYSGKPCGCGCGKLLEHKDIRTCHKCENKDPFIASTKIRLPCWGNGKCCIA